MSADIWVCGDCRSVNNGKAKRCYSCNVPRATVEVDAATAPVVRAPVEQPRTLLESVERMDIRSRSSWLIGLAAAVLIAITTFLQASLIQTAADFVNDPTLLDDPVATGQAAPLALGAIASFLLAGLAWSTWIAIVVGNVPAATGQWPKHSPAYAFFGGWIPILWLWRPYLAVREVVGRLTGGTRIGPILVALAWWIAWLLLYFLPGFVLVDRILNRADETPVGSVIYSYTTTVVLLVAAAVLAVGVIAVVEVAQRRAMAHRQHVVVAPRGA